ncbi:rCG50169 [Rattus norvegicus]|uniref:RCG50169 n=1 Tax=Rattus norvegicus TaxID=10116 RepID=A6JZM6_RAT|nr:rCG50169 [Rattus norvegicus]
MCLKVASSPCMQVLMVS